MDKNIFKKEELCINEDLKVTLISYEGDRSPYRFLTNQDEFIVLDSYNYGAFHGRKNTDGNLTITYMDPNFEMTVSKEGILIENSKEE